MLTLEFEETCLENFLHLTKLSLPARDNNRPFHLVFTRSKKEKMNGHCRSENAKKKKNYFSLLQFSAGSWPDDH